MKGTSRIMCLLAMGALGCGGDLGEDAPEFAHAWATGVVSFAPGEGAGYGGGAIEASVLGAPTGRGVMSGSLDVLSLGVGGEIVLEFDEAIEDGPGVDLIVFENAFWAQGDPGRVFEELGEVAVSEDGESWSVFSCAPERAEAGPSWPGCAGWSPTLEHKLARGHALDWEEIGGDGFDLAVVGLERARFVRVRDLSAEGLAPTAGFDLDAVGAVRR